MSALVCWIYAMNINSEIKCQTKKLFTRWNSTVSLFACVCNGKVIDKWKRKLEFQTSTVNSKCACCSSSSSLESLIAVLFQSKQNIALLHQPNTHATYTLINYSLFYSVSLSMCVRLPANKVITCCSYWTGNTNMWLCAMHVCLCYSVISPWITWTKSTLTSR